MARKDDCKCAFLNITNGLVKIEPTKVKGYILATCPICMAQYKVEPESFSRERILHA